MKHLKIGCSLFIIYLALGCRVNPSLPNYSYYQYSVPVSGQRVDSTVIAKVDNILHCPIRVFASSSTYNSDTVVVAAKSAREVRLNFPIVNENIKIYTALGDPSEEIRKNEMDFPFEKEKTYKIIQGYNGDFSHKTINSKFALDFSLKVNDIICSADDGFVVGVIKDYKYGGKTEKWTPYSNFITIYHPQSGLYTQYVHLVHEGASVKVGDFVKRGQAIGKSGVTGYTTGPHLHFNVLKPRAGDQLESTDITFKSGISGFKLKKGDLVKNTETYD